MYVSSISIFEYSIWQLEFAYQLHSYSLQGGSMAVDLRFRSFSLAMTCKSHRRLLCTVISTVPLFVFFWRISVFLLRCLLIVKPC